LPSPCRYALETVRVDALSPAGAPLGAAASGSSGGSAVTMSGGGFVDYGDVRCTFGAHGSSAGVVISLSSVRCPVPDISPTLGPLVSLNVGLSLDGQSNASTTAPFSLYAAALEATTPLLAPLGQALALTLSGQGFVALAGAGAVCALARPNAASGAHELEAVATVESATRATCAFASTNALAAAGAYEVRLSLNSGVDNVQSATSTQPTVELFDIANVRVDALSPPGGPTGSGTTITLTGVGFRAASGLCCVLDGAAACGAAATLLASSGGFTRASCVIPPRAAAGLVFVELSLGGGAAGTTTSSGRVFAAFAPPSRRGRFALH
jgi:hypothetical protein